MFDQIENCFEVYNKHYITYWFFGPNYCKISDFLDYKCKSHENIIFHHDYNIMVILDELSYTASFFISTDIKFTLKVKMLLK